MLPDEYEDFDLSELTDELAGVDRIIDQCQTKLSQIRKTMNQKMELREDLIDRIKLLSQIKGWQRG